MKRDDEPKEHSTLGGDYRRPRGHIRLRDNPWLRVLVIVLALAAIATPILLSVVPW